MSQSQPQTPEEKGRAAGRNEDVNMTDNDNSDNYDQMTAQNTEGIRTELSQLNDNIQRLNQNVVQAGNIIAEMNAQTSPSSDSATGQETSETDTDVTIEHEYDADELENLAYDWINSAEGFYADLLPEAVEVEFGQVEGEVGLLIEAGKPWNVGCYNGDDWTNKEKWDNHQEAFKSVMQSKDDEITYHGEPDHFNFLPAADAEEVCG